MDNYKKTLYSKKFSNDINFVAIQSKRQWNTDIIFDCSRTYTYNDTIDDILT